MSLQATYDIGVLEFYENSIGASLLLKPNQVVSVKNYFLEHKHYQNIPKFPPEGPISSVSSYALINKVLLIGNGKLSICGNNVMKLISGLGVSQLDFYFDSYDKSEIESIFNKCVDALSLCIHIRDDFIAKTTTKVGVAPSFQFHFNNFKDKASILHSFGDSLDKQGWNPISGYFCSITAGVMITLLNCTNEHPMTLYSYRELKGVVNVQTELSRKYIVLRNISNLNRDVLQHIVHYYVLLEVLSSKKRLIIN